MPRLRTSRIDERVEIERLGRHHKLVSTHAPRVPGAIGVHLDAEPIGIPQVKRFAHKVIGRTAT